MEDESAGLQKSAYLRLGEQDDIAHGWIITAES